MLDKGWTESGQRLDRAWADNALDGPAGRPDWPEWPDGPDKPDGINEPDRPNGPDRPNESGKPDKGGRVGQARRVGKTGQISQAGQIWTGWTGLLAQPPELEVDRVACKTRSNFREDSARRSASSHGG